MRQFLETSCQGCGQRVVLRGGRIYTPLPCSRCGAAIRGRAEIGGYRLGGIFSRSGLGVIFRAQDQGGASLAVKIVQPPFAAEPVDLEYFIEEVWAVVRMDLPHTVRIFSAGVESGLAWIAMEWLSHGSLADRLAISPGKKLREAEALAFARQTAEALAAAESAGHLHRDIKLSNLVLADLRTVKLSDFGLAALHRIAAASLATIWGCASAVAPERMRNETEEAHSDIYALGAALFTALNGEPPHGGEPHAFTLIEQMEADENLHLAEVAPGLHEQTIRVLEKMLAAEPARRFQHWSEVVAQLSQAAALVTRRDAGARALAPVRDLSPAERKPARITSAASRWRVAALLLIAALAIAAAIYWWQHAALR